jgi:hypothetical protein
MEVYVNNISSVLNNIYCLSQGAASTITNLRAYPQIAKNADSHKILMILKELHQCTLITCMDIECDLMEKSLENHLSEIFSEGQALEDIYLLFINNIPLPENHILVRKLRLQLSNLLSSLIKLDQLSSKIGNIDSADFIAQ